MPNDDYLVSFRNLSLRLKKRRFLRKSGRGVMESAAVDYAALHEALARDGLHQHAAFCALAVARCQHALGLEDAEGHWQIVAGGHLWTEELAANSCRFEGFQDSTVDAMQCYLMAVQSQRRCECSSDGALSCCAHVVPLAAVPAICMSSPTCTVS